MHIERLSTTADFARIQPDWNALVRGIPFLRHEWLSAWWPHYGSGRELCILTVRDAAGNLCGAAPWYWESTAIAGRVLRPLGSGEVCSDYLSLLALPEQCDDVAGAVAEYLAACDESGAKASAAPVWDALELPAVDPHEVANASLLHHCARLGLAVQDEEGPNCWRIELPSSWDEFLAGFSKSHRKQTRRVERGLLGSGRAILHTIESPADFEPAWKILVDLHQRRRKSLGQPGCFSDSRFAGFLGDAVRGLLASGKARLHWVALDGTPVAAEVHLFDQQIAYAYQSGVDPDRLDDEPGRLLTIAVIQAALAQGERALDLLRGDEPYKAHFRAVARPMRNVRVGSRRATAQLRSGLRTAAVTIKDWLKTGLELMGAR